MAPWGVFDLTGGGGGGVGGGCDVGGLLLHDRQLTTTDTGQETGDIVVIPRGWCVYVRVVASQAQQ